MTRRYELMKNQLSSGGTVKMTVSGNSLSPLVNNKDTCLFHPILPGWNSHIEAGEVVICCSMPDRKICCGLVWRRYEFWTDCGTQADCYIIGNAKEGDERVLGHCLREHMYGILTKAYLANTYPGGDELTGTQRLQQPTLERLEASSE